jgi:hypothetical protein
VFALNACESWDTDSDLAVRVGLGNGLSYGQSDEIGYYVAEDPVSPKDLQARILHLLGLDPYRFGYEYQGLFNRLIGPTDEGKVLKKLIV